MAYVPLDLRCSDDCVKLLVKHSIEEYLEEVHYLLAASYPAANPMEEPSRHFTRSAGLMLVATIGATSALSTFDKDGKRRSGDAKHFKECVRNYFPWGEITIQDGEHRSPTDRREAAVDSLYSVVRNPLVHSAGLVGKTDQRTSFLKLHARSQNLAESEPRIEEIARYPSLDGQTVIEFRYNECRIYPDFMYWCVRRMVEAYIADPKNEQAILQHCTS